MGKASSSKKVARAARAGGSASAEQRKLGFPAALVVVCILGVVLVAFARNERTSATADPSDDGDIRYAYGVYTCDDFAPALTAADGVDNGVTPEPDGTLSVDRLDATVGDFAEATGITLSDTGFTMPDGTELTNGQDCGGEPGRVILARWPAGKPDADPVTFTSGLATTRLGEDDGVFTLAFLPESTEGSGVPRPTSVGALGGDAEAETTTTTAEGESTTTSTAADGESTTTSAAEGASTTSSSAPDTTTTTTP